MFCPHHYFKMGDVKKTSLFFGKSTWLFVLNYDIFIQISTGLYCMNIHSAVQDVYQKLFLLFIS